MLKIAEFFYLFSIIVDENENAKKEISRNIGIIFMRRSEINLNSDILDTPDIFWNQKSEIEDYYKMI